MNPVLSASGSVPQILNAQGPLLAGLEPWEASADRRLGSRSILEALAAR
jgi:hypothetical protein